MSLAHAILGFLRDSPLTGYDLKTRRFDASVRHFWPADQAQIYRTLDRLQDQGHIRSEVEPQDGRPDRKVYQITPAGRAELQQWVATNRPDLPPVRQPLLVQLFFADDQPDTALRALLADQRTQHERVLARYQTIPLPPLDTPGIDRATLLQRMTLELGLRIEHTYLEWLAACQAALDDASA